MAKNTALPIIGMEGRSLKDVWLKTCLQELEYCMMNVLEQSFMKVTLRKESSKDLERFSMKMGR